MSIQSARYPRLKQVGFLEGRRVLITGAAGGIGNACCKEFSNAGAEVVGCDLSGSDVDLDVRDIKALADLVSRYDEDFDVLINGAGIMPTGPFLEMSLQSIKDQIDINLWGVINGMRVVLPGMRRRRQGHIINIASILGKIPIKGGMIYSATKYAVVGLSESARKEYESEGILVSHILPTLVNTQMIAGIEKPFLIDPVSPEKVAMAIVRAVRTGQIDIWVPGKMKWLIGLGKLLPRSWGEYLAGEVIGLNRMFMDANYEVRKAYEDRVVGR